MKAFLISGDRSGSGKTSISLGIAAALAEARKVQAFKVGMDYIDPSYLTAATGRACRNLDSFVLSRDQIQAVFYHACKGADIALVEGVRGLYEGSDAMTDTGSTASIARALQVPVVLVVQARSITRSAAALVKGFQAFDPGVHIAGVILNQVSGRSHIEKATTAIEHTCGIPVLGAVPRGEGMGLSMRHLGLVPFREGEEDPAFRERIRAITAVVKESVDIPCLLEISAELSLPPGDPPLFRAERPPDVTVAVAYDAAFNFYYADLFDLLPALGASVRRFSPLADEVPAADGVIIGGGYPELFLPRIEAAGNARDAILECARAGTPVYGECGGLMFLSGSIRVTGNLPGTEAGRPYRMCGALPAASSTPPRRIVRYVEGSVVPGTPFGPDGFRGHEFHYAEVQPSPGAQFAYRLTRGTGIHDGLDGLYEKRTIGSFTHLHPVASLEFFRRFVGLCREE